MLSHLIHIIFWEYSEHIEQYESSTTGDNCVRRLISSELHLSVFGTEMISSDKRSKDILDTL